MFVTPRGGERGGGREREKESEIRAEEEDEPCEFSSLPENRFCSLCVSHGSDLGERSSAEREASDPVACLRRGQVSSLSLPLSLCNVHSLFRWSAGSTLASAKRRATSAEFGCGRVHPGRPGPVLRVDAQLVLTVAGQRLERDESKLPSRGPASAMIIPISSGAQREER